VTRSAPGRLKKAIENQELALHYQPIVDLRTRKPVNAEALLRWKNPGEHEEEANELSAEAEKSEAMFDLGDWTMRMACEDAVRWQRKFPGLKLNLNLSAREFQREDLIDRLAEVFDDTGIEPHKINLEITESASISDPERASKILWELKERGTGLWLDDFGTGHSSLQWLKNFPIDGLKIPDAFICEITTDPKCEVIVGAIMTMAHALELAVVAEGVETGEQLQRLQEHGCDLIQGFYFFKPMPAEEMIETLGNRQQATGNREKKRR